MLCCGAAPPASPRGQTRHPRFTDEDGGAQRVEIPDPRSLQWRLLTEMITWPWVQLRARCDVTAVPGHPPRVLRGGFVGHSLFGPLPPPEVPVSRRSNFLSHLQGRLGKDALS